MSAFTFSDHKLGGRLTAAVDAIGAGHLRRAAGILNEIADDLNAEAEAATGLLSEEAKVPSFAPTKPYAEGEVVIDPKMGAMVAMAPQPAQPIDMQMCARNVHSYSAPDPDSGWRTCSTCGIVNVAPPENNGFVDMSARR